MAICSMQWTANRRMKEDACPQKVKSTRGIGEDWEGETTLFQTDFLVRSSLNEGIVSRSRWHSSEHGSCPGALGVSK